MRDSPGPGRLHDLCVVARRRNSRRIQVARRGDRVSSRHDRDALSVRRSSRLTDKGIAFLGFADAAGDVDGWDDSGAHWSAARISLRPVGRPIEVGRRVWGALPRGQDHACGSGSTAATSRSRSGRRCCDGRATERSIIPTSRVRSGGRPRREPSAGPSARTRSRGSYRATTCCGQTARSAATGGASNASGRCSRGSCRRRLRRGPDADRGSRLSASSSSSRPLSRFGSSALSMLSWTLRASRGSAASCPQPWRAACWPRSSRSAPAPLPAGSGTSRRSSRGSPRGSPASRCRRSG